MKIILPHLLLSGLIVLVIPPGGFSQPTPEAAPHITFTETAHDGGTVWEGEKASHVFKFKNTGDLLLRVEKVRTSCGCTAALISKEEIAPGEEGEIKTEFNTSRYRGKQKKYIYVNTNDPLRPTVQLEFSVEVKTAGTISPSSINFRKVTRGQKVSQSVRFTPEEGSLKVIKIETQPEFFQGRIIGGKTVEGGVEAPVEIEVTLSPDTPIGHYSGSLTIHTDHPKFPKSQCSLTAVVEGLVQYSPRTVFFNQNEQENRTKKSVRLTKGGKPDLEILGIETTLPQFQTELIPIKPGSEYEVSIQPAPAASPSQLRGNIIVRTNQAEEKEIKIPLVTSVTKK